MDNRMKSVSLAVEQLFTKYKRVPVWKKGKSDLTPWEIYLRIPNQPYKFLLESGKTGRYSFIGAEPVSVLQRKGGDLLEELRVWMKERRSPEREELLELQRLLQPRESGDTQLPPVLCGAFGFFSYDLARSIERLPEFAEDDLATPDVYLMEPAWLVVKDHLTQDLFFVLNLSSHEQLETAEQTLEEMTSWLENGETFDNSQGDIDVASRLYPVGGTVSQERAFSMSDGEFIRAVETVKEYIRAGDVFQVNLSLRESRPVFVSNERIYQHLREINPSPYMGLFVFPELTLISSSPELLVRLRNGRADTRPIAGTRKRTGDRDHDLQMVQELIENEKERAEHVMLVDLERNDLGRVCRYGSVQVEELMVIEEYSHVMHIVSHISGELREGTEAVDLLAAVFPGGTITGAPKIRTMEIIEELEPVRRGVYTGSIGWMSFAGDMEVNIAIRTMVVQNGRAYVQAGAGIVIDSIAEREYKESLRKAEALWQAFERAHRG